MGILLLYIEVDDTRNVAVINSKTTTTIVYQIVIYILSLLPIVGYTIFIIVYVVLKKTSRHKKISDKLSKQLTSNVANDDYPDEKHPSSITISGVYQSLRQSQKQDRYLNSDDFEIINH